MAGESSSHEIIDLWQYDMPIKFRTYDIRKGDPVFLHWHDKIELLFFLKGRGGVQCGQRKYSADDDDLIVVNSNELHQIWSESDHLEYHCIIFDAALLQSRRADACEANYINPIFQSRILFQNKIEKDAEVKTCIGRICKEYQDKKIGYELAVKSWMYQLVVHLLRYHVKLVLTPQAHEMRMKKLKRFNQVLKYIDGHYNEAITIEQMCGLIHISRYYFCHQFKNMTGSTLSEYLNLLRINKARELLETGTANVMETAYACGFENLNYFSRLFKKYQRVTPSEVLRRCAQKTELPALRAGSQPNSRR